jgi:hypothetical protein
LTPETYFVVTVVVSAIDRAISVAAAIDRVAPPLAPVVSESIAPSALRVGRPW